MPTPPTPMADTSDLRAAVSLAGRGAAATTRIVRGVHAAVASRAFTMTGRLGTPARLLHDGISRSVYTVVAASARAGATAVGAGIAAGRATDASYRPLGDRPRGNTAIGALNGAWGDVLARDENPLALSMAVRRDGRDVAPAAETLRAAYPDATDDVVVFVHGLCETDASWRLGAVGHYGDPDSTHGSRLQMETGATPVYLRYNTGLHVCDNGEQLARLLETLAAAWPTALRRLTLVGHSMGGLVIRSACHVAEQQHRAWVPLVRRVVYLGSPHLGAPLEVGAASIVRALRRLPETKPFGDALAGRSVGIKDLRYGDVLAEDWSVLDDLDASRAEPTTCLPLLASAAHFYVGATIGERRDTVAARVLGDALVPWHSASGDGKVRRLGLAVDRGRHLGRLHHFDLLNHPRVYSVLRDWLVEPG